MDERELLLSGRFSDLELYRRSRYDLFVPGDVVKVVEHQVGNVTYHNVKVSPDAIAGDSDTLGVLISGSLATVISVDKDPSKQWCWLLLLSEFGFGWADELEGLQHV